MTKKKTYIPKPKLSTAKEPTVAYGANRIKIFQSFEEQAAFELEQMAKLSSIEILQQLRQLINVAYGMKGYNPENLPTKHTITINSNQ